MEFSFTILTAGKESEATEDSRQTVEALARRHYLNAVPASAAGNTHTWRIEGTTQHYREFAEAVERVLHIEIVESTSSPWK